MARLGKKAVIGEPHPEADRWTSVISSGECLTGIYGVYSIVDRKADIRKLHSIGFYFGEPEETFEVLMNDDRYRLNDVFLILGMIVVAPIIICAALAIVYYSNSEEP